MAVRRLTALRWLFLAAGLLCALPSAQGVSAAQERIEFAHRGVTFLGLQPGPAADYDVPVMAAGPAVEKIRAALDLLLETSPYSVAATAVMGRIADPRPLLAEGSGT